MAGLFRGRAEEMEEDREIYAMSGRASHFCKCGAPVYNLQGLI